MATKRKASDDDCQTIKAYVHNVSDVATAATSNTRYFNGLLQTKHDQFLRFVSFSPEKQEDLKSAENSKSPIKISECVVKPKGQSKEVIVRKKSNISVIAKLDFQRSTRADIKSEPKDLIEVKTANTLCSVNIKVVSLSSVSSTQTRYGQRNLQRATVADKTKAMALTLWEKHVNSIQTNSFYKIEDLISTNYQGDLQLSTTAKTSFKKVDEFEVSPVEMEQVEIKETTGTIISCNVKSVAKCVNCTKTLTSESILKEGDLIRCDQCQAKQKIATMQMSMNVQVKEDSGIVHKFMIFHDPIRAFLSDNRQEQMNSDEIENHFLLLDKVSVKHKAMADVVLEINQIK